MQASWHHTRGKRKTYNLNYKRKIRSLEGVNSSVKSINCLGLKCSISTCFCHCFYNFNFQGARQQFLLSFFPAILSFICSELQISQYLFRKQL